MRILFLSNFYPPYEIGGEEQSCQDIVNHLKRRRHDAIVLTSTHGADNTVEEEGVYRRLALKMELIPIWNSVRFFVGRKRRERESLTCLQQLVADFKPDVIFICGMWNLPRSLPALAEELLPKRVVYRLADYWPTLPSQHECYWRAPGRRWFTRLPKWLLGRLALALLALEGPQPQLKFKHTYCISAATRDELVKAGIPVQEARIIHNGISLEEFTSRSVHNRVDHGHKGPSLLYLGRLSPEKGVDTAMQALAELAHVRGVDDVKLTLIGPGKADYEAYLRNLVTQKGVRDRVIFYGHVPREKVPGLLNQFDVLVVPSKWPEPFGRVVLEGMAAGLAVVGTAMGGMQEALVDGETGLTFAPGDAKALADRIEQLIDDPLLRRRLGEAGRRIVAERFTVERMVDEVEAYLQEIVSSAGDNDL